MSTAAQMTGMAPELAEKSPEDRRMVIRRSTMIALIAFLTLIDLFGSQALLPTLVETYGVTPASMGFAVNASTIGMAFASLVVAVFARRIDRKRGIWVCLALLSIPTVLLAHTDDLTTFTLLRVAQGVFMSAAFTLTLTYLSEECSITAIGGAMAAYITGNVASNLFGRLLASELAGNLGLAQSFYGFAALNLAGAVAAYLYLGARDSHGHVPDDAGSVIEAWKDHLTNARLVAMVGIGFILLFVFVATFTYANFILSEAPFALPQTMIGLVYFVFTHAILTTPLAAASVTRYGARASFHGAIAVSSRSPPDMWAARRPRTTRRPTGFTWPATIWAASPGPLSLVRSLPWPGGAWRYWRWRPSRRWPGCCRCGCSARVRCPRLARPGTRRRGLI